MKINLDTKRLLCPMPVIRLGEAIEKIEAGDTIQVTATDPSPMPRHLDCTKLGE
jgi:tRNA 2-thiouridine synthesizing protein A